MAEPASIKVTILAPAYQEEAVVGQFVEAALASLLPSWELLIVDDGSTDGTADTLSRLEEADPRLRVVTHERNRGLGAALASGFAAARGRIVVTVDADLSHPLELIPRLVAACNDADAAFASRFVPGGGMVGVPWLRAWLSRIGNLVFRLLFWTRLRDLTTGLRAYRTDLVRRLGFRAKGFEAQLEISVRLIRRGAHIAEVPLLLKDRAAGTSKMRYLPLIPKYGTTVVRMLWVRWGPFSGPSAGSR